MQIDLTREQEEFIRRALETGRLKRVEDAVQQALDLWIEQEREREELLTALDDAEASLVRGEAITITEGSLRELAEDVKRRGRMRVAKDPQTPH